MMGRAIKCATALLVLSTFGFITGGAAGEKISTELLDKAKTDSRALSKYETAGKFFELCNQYKNRSDRIRDKSFQKFIDEQMKENNATVGYCFYSIDFVISRKKCKANPPYDEIMYFMGLFRNEELSRSDTLGAIGTALALSGHCKPESPFDAGTQEMAARMRKDWKFEKTSNFRTR